MATPSAPNVYIFIICAYLCTFSIIYILKTERGMNYVPNLCIYVEEKEICILTWLDMDYPITNLGHPITHPFQERISLFFSVFCSFPFSLPFPTA